MGTLKTKSRIRLMTVYIILAVIVVAVFVIAEVRLTMLGSGLKNMQEIAEEYAGSLEAVHNMREASDYLTSQARLYVMNGDTENLKAYLNEVSVDRRRDNALEVLKGYQEDNASYDALTAAVENSNALAEVELDAMALASEVYGMSSEDRQKYFEGRQTDPANEALSDEEKRAKSISMMFDDNYQTMKDTIMAESWDSLEQLINDTKELELVSYQTAMDRVRVVQIMFLLILIVVFAVMILTGALVILPLRNSVRLIRESRALPTNGATEYVYLAEAYNRMRELTKQHQEQLSFDATHDELTGLYNRKIFEERREEMTVNGIAMLLIDVDYFKSVNDTYGHEMGDRVLKTIAEILASSFRLEDYVCRIGGDEFAVIMIHMNPSLRNIVQMKIDRVRSELDKRTDIPKTTLSIGVAFSVEGNREDVFRKADEALYVVKEKGRNGVSFYQE